MAYRLTIEPFESMENSSEGHSQVKYFIQRSVPSKSGRPVPVQILLQSLQETVSPSKAVENLSDYLVQSFTQCDLGLEKGLALSLRKLLHIEDVDNLNYDS